MTKALKVLFQLLVSGLFLYIALRNVDWNSAKEAYSTLDVRYFFGGIILHFSSFIVRALRWKWLMLPIKQIRYSSSFNVLSISYAANNVIPLRAGDVLRAVMIGEKENVNKFSSFTTVLLERISDGITLLLFMAIGLSVIESNQLWISRVVWLSVIGFIGSILFIFLLYHLQEKFINLIDRLLKSRSEKLATKVVELLRNILVAFKIVKSTLTLLKIALTSIFIWCLEGSIFTLGAMSFGIALHESILLGIVTVAIVNLGIMIPSSPGYVGTFEFFCMLSLALFGFSNNTAASFSVLVHLGQYIPITVIGCLLWLFMGIKQSKVKQQELEAR